MAAPPIETTVAKSINQGEFRTHDDVNSTFPSLVVPESHHVRPKLVASLGRRVCHRAHKCTSAHGPNTEVSTVHAAADKRAIFRVGHSPLCRWCLTVLSCGQCDVVLEKLPLGQRAILTSLLVLLLCQDRAKDGLDGLGVARENRATVTEQSRWQQAKPSVSRVFQPLRTHVACEKSLKSGRNHQSASSPLCRSGAPFERAPENGSNLTSRYKSLLGDYRA